MADDPWRSERLLTTAKRFTVAQTSIYGELTKRGQVRVRGPLLRIRATRGDSDGWFRFKTAKTGRLLKHPAKLDYKFTVRRLQKKRIYVVPITRGPVAMGWTGHLYSCIVMVYDGGRYHWIGVMKVDGDNLGSEVGEEGGQF